LEIPPCINPSFKDVHGKAQTYRAVQVVVIE
jgi:hypothetical protein